MILLFKAQLRGVFNPDLFASPVEVHGYTTKQGTYVAPHTALRRKAREHATPSREVHPPEPPLADDDLFAVRAPESARAITKHEPVTAPAPAPSPEPPVAPKEPMVLVPSAADPGAKKPRKARAKVKAAEPALVTSAPVSAAAPVLDGIEVWGVPAGTKPAMRKKLNKLAVTILESKTDDEITAGDRAVLAQYSGNGGQGVGASLNEFYTDPGVALAMWKMLANAGFKGGDVLEPSSGIGVFMHTAPAGVHIAASEIDPISSRIASILARPAGHEVTNSSLENFATQDGRLFDAVIGNPPFGPRGGNLADDKRSIVTAENYFLDTALDKTKDGGLVAMIVPTGVMDSSGNRTFRRSLLLKGEFLGGARLPNTAFAAAHTKVTSDILVFRKRPQASAAALGTMDLDQAEKLVPPDEHFVKGTWFTDGPGRAHIMGKLEPGWRSKANLGNDITVSGSMHGIADALAKWVPTEPPSPTPTVDDVVAALAPDLGAQRRASSASLKPAYIVAKLGDEKVENGIRYILQGEPPRWHRAEDVVPDAVTDAQAIAGMIDGLVNRTATDPAYTRAALIEALDEYVKQHGIPSKNKDFLKWMASPSAPRAEGDDDAAHRDRIKNMTKLTGRLLGAVGTDGGYSDLVTGAQREKSLVSLDTAALEISMAKGGFTPDALALVTGTDQDAVLDHLYATAGYAIMPDGETWSVMDTYLSGDMWTKYDEARAAAAKEGITPALRDRYLAQAAALEAAIDPQSLEDVEIRINSGFVNSDDVTAWLQSKANAYAEGQGRNEGFYKGAKLTFEDGVYTFRHADGREVTQSPGLGGNGSLKKLDKWLNRTGARKEDRELIEGLNDDFRDWLISSDRRDEVEERYNRKYRGFRTLRYSETPFAVPGLNPELTVNGYHYAGLRWALAARKGIIAADVGLGKTGRGLMLAKIAKATGQRKKPAFVVPKSVLANWASEAQFWFPGSKMLVIGETFKRGPDGKVLSVSDDEKTRQRKLSELQQNDYDFVFFSLPAWNKIDVSPELKERYAAASLDNQRGEALGHAGDKKRAKIKAAFEQAQAAKELGERDKNVYFNDLGIDMLILDEGHAYKNLFSAKSRWGDSPRFLGGSGESGRAQDTNYKTKALREANGGDGVYMLTATPTKNSPLEVYSMLSHIAPEAFEEMGIKNSEEFIDRFVEFEQDNILGTDGEMTTATVCAGFKNLSELRQVMNKYIDRKTAEDVGLVIPKGTHIEHSVDMTDEQEAVYQQLRKDAKAQGPDAPHIFSTMSQMGKASLDLGLLGKPSGRMPKVEACLEQVMKYLPEGGQIIFCDANDMHEKVAKELVARGIPRDQIAIINADVAKSSADRQKISDDFNAGRVRVVIGNTATMGEGVNLQKKTSDIHHLDLAWEPSSMQQRNGRGVRQGNKLGAVRIHTYLANKSFDGYRLQTILAKKDWQDLLWNGGDRVENLAREGAMTREEKLIMLSADPDKERAQYEADKAGALERQTATRTAEAIGKFERLQMMQGALKALVEKRAGQERGKETGGTSLARLERNIAAGKEYLKGNKYFPHKDLLDAYKPVLIQPKTNAVWTAGSAFVAKGIYSGGQPAKWVVESINPDKQTMECRRYGETKDYMRQTFRMDKMPEGDEAVSVIPYSEKEDRDEYEKEMANRPYRPPHMKFKPIVPGAVSKNV